MGDDISLARSEEEGQPVLLAGVRTGTPATESEGGDKRQEHDSDAKGTKRPKTLNTSSKGKVSSKAKGTHGGSTKLKGRISDGKDREPDRGTKRKNSPRRRSAKELGIEFPGSCCPSGEPHYYIGDSLDDGGSFYRCIKCLKHVWLPAGMDDAHLLGVLMHKYGTTLGYQMFIDTKPEVRVKLAKFQDIWRISKVVLGELEFGLIVASIMEDKRYDYYHRPKNRGGDKWLSQ